MELGNDFVLPCPVGDCAETLGGVGVLADYDLSHLPITSVDDRLDFYENFINTVISTMIG